MAKVVLPRKKFGGGLDEYGRGVWDTINALKTRLGLLEWRQAFSEEDEQTTTSTSYKTALRVPLQLPAGKYKLEYSWECAGDTATDEFITRVLIDDTEVAYHLQDLGNLNQYDTTSGFYVDTLQGMRVFSVEFKMGTPAGGTGTIRRVRLYLERVS